MVLDDAWSNGETNLHLISEIISEDDYAEEFEVDGNELEIKLNRQFSQQNCKQYDVQLHSLRHTRIN